MNSLFSAVQFSIILALAGLSFQSLVNIVPEPEISKNDNGIKSTLGEVYGTRPCGGNDGRVVQWRLEGCDTTDSPCRFPANETLRRSELDFIPSSDIDQLGLRIIVGFEGTTPKTVYENPIRNSTVKAGEQYTSKSAGGVSEDVKGKILTVQYILYRADQQDKPTEICAEADFQMI